MVNHKYEQLDESNKIINIGSFKQHLAKTNDDSVYVVTTRKLVKYCRCAGIHHLRYRIYATL